MSGLSVPEKEFFSSSSTFIYFSWIPVPLLLSGLECRVGVNGFSDCCETQAAKARRGWEHQIEKD
jgi:hypothetical protein